MTSLHKYISEKKINDFRMLYFASIAHDLRSPINTILSITQEMLRTVPEVNKQMVEICLASSLFLLEQIQDVFDLSKIVMDQFSLQSEWFDINCVFAELHKIMAVNFKIKNLSLVFEMDPCLQRALFSDPKRIK